VNGTHDAWPEYYARAFREYAEKQP